MQQLQITCNSHSFSYRARRWEGHSGLYSVLIYFKSFRFMCCLFIRLWSQSAVWGREIVSLAVIYDIHWFTGSLTVFLASFNPHLSPPSYESQLSFTKFFFLLTSKLDTVHKVLRILSTLTSESFPKRRLPRLFHIRKSVVGGRLKLPIWTCHSADLNWVPYMLILEQD